MVEVSDGASCADALKEGLSGKRFKAAIACKAGDTLLDLTAPVPTTTETLTLTPVTADTPEGLGLIRHSAAHVMAAAVKKLFPAAKVTIGPSIENGFYYDFDVETPFSPDQFEAIEAEMQRIIDAAVPFERMDISKADAVKLFSDMGEPYKVELIEGLEDGTITLYRNGDFVDLCRGPHIPNAGFVKAFKLLSVAGAYWRGDEKNRMLSRIYATAFADAKDLKEYLNRIEEAKRRDHRKLGKELGLFMMTEEGPGFPFFLPKGMVLKNTMLDYWRQCHKRYGYVEISTPIILNQELWHRSGHWDHYKDNMYTTVIDGEDYAIKPMNCPGGMLVYKSEPHSYRDLPLRMAELGLVHRHEMSGALHGLFRVRCFTQDDAHIFMTPDQMKDEIKNVVKLFDEIYSTFGLTYQIELSTMPEDHMGDEKDWKFAEDTLQAAITEMGKDFVINAGDGAFYGPKLDFHLADSLGRTWQCGTIQLDFQMPERFDLEYVGEDGEKHRPVMIHRALLGSIERFIGVITEHFAGAFPAWLSPVQVKLLPVTDRAMDYAKNVAAQLDSQGFRVEVDGRNEKIGKKIREATLEKIPFMLVVGDRDMEAGTVSVRTRTGEDLGAMSLADFAAKLHEIVDSKARQ